ncbi:MAG: AMP-binding protein, partial [bacterium]|nr:AMP-binding protein [bacterium]
GNYKRISRPRSTVKIKRRSSKCEAPPQLRTSRPATSHFELSKTLYRTGDLARWREDGNLEFMGRKDRQMNVRGYRVESGEIENILLNHNSIENVVVIGKKESRGETHLCAYIVSKKQLTAAMLREYLLGLLPYYMVPTYFVFLDRLPLTHNGKVDIKALPEPAVVTRTMTYVSRQMMEELTFKVPSYVTKGKDSQEFPPSSGEQPVLSDEEKERLLVTFNDTLADYPTDKLIHQLVDEQVERTPDRIAVAGPLLTKHQEQQFDDHMHISYLQLNQRINQLTRLLRSKGAIAGEIVAIMAKRSIEMTIGILAIIKTGAAFMPLDPLEPLERIRFMMEDARAKLLLVTGAADHDD